MIVNICANRFNNVYKQWARAYHYIIKTFLELGYEIHRSQHMDWDSTFEEYNLPIIEQDSDDYIYVHNHTWRRELEKQGFYTGKKLFIIKPTGPTTNHFTIDSEGYACSSSITYEKPDFENVSSNLFFSTSIPEWKVERTNKWSEQVIITFADSVPYVPEDHILILGQTPGDDTNSKMSFGDHWEKIVSIVSEIKDDNLLVIKLHPFQQDNAAGETWEELYLPVIKEWQQEGITVFYSNESLYDILPYTKLAILENSTAGIECMMYDVPIISYGYPEYHWVTKDLRHLNKLQEYINDTSWFNLNLSRSWLTWYCTRHQCYNYESTKRRVLEILNDSPTT